MYVINVLRIENRSKSLESDFFSFKIPILSPKKLSWLLMAKQSRDILVCTFAKKAERIRKAVQRGGQYCVVGALNNQRCRNTSYFPGITMHQFPLDPKIWSQWGKFVQRHRVDFGEPINKYGSLCSAHFEPSCYPMRLRLSLQGTEETKPNKVLIKGSIPTRATVLPAIHQKPTDCGKRQVSCFVFAVVLLRFYVVSNNLDVVSDLKETFVKYLDR